MWNSYFNEGLVGYWESVAAQHAVENLYPSIAEKISKVGFYGLTPHEQDIWETAISEEELHASQEVASA